MIGTIYIDNCEIGKADLKIIGESMGVIGGLLEATRNYEKFQQEIQGHFEKKGICNSDDFNFRTVLDGVELVPEGGIGITDSKEFYQIFVEICGLDQDTLTKVRGYNLETEE